MGRVRGKQEHFRPGPLLSQAQAGGAGQRGLAHAALAGEEQQGGGQGGHLGSSFDTGNSGPILLLQGLQAGGESGLQLGQSAHDTVDRGLVLLLQRLQACGEPDLQFAEPALDAGDRGPLLMLQRLQVAGESGLQLGEAALDAGDRELVLLSG